MPALDGRKGLAIVQSPLDRRRDCVEMAKGLLGRTMLKAMGPIGHESPEVAFGKIEFKPAIALAGEGPEGFLGRGRKALAPVDVVFRIGACYLPRRGGRGSKTQGNWR